MIKNIFIIEGQNFLHRVIAADIVPDLVNFNGRLL